MTEIWKPVVGHEGCYEVSDLGQVRSLDREWRQKTRYGSFYTHRKAGILLRPGAGSHKYPTVVLGRGNTRTVHSLVAEAFIGPRPIGQEVRHKNGNRADPRAENLCYGTRLDNINDARAHGTWMSPKRTAWGKSGNARRKFSTEVVVEVRAATSSIAEIATKYGMSHTHVWAIRNGKQRALR